VTERPDLTAQGNPRFRCQGCGNATEPEEQKRLCSDIQLQAFRDVPFVPLGAFFFAAAYRKSLIGILKGRHSTRHEREARLMSR
jgi:hypothetical protein